MGNTIQTGCAAGCGIQGQAYRAKAARQGGFPGMGRQTGRTDSTAFSARTNSTNNGIGTPALPARLMLELASCAAGRAQVDAPAAAEPVSLETMLEARYPNIAYHVFDASSSYWKTRNDYPHYLLYQDGDAAKETLENWQPSGPNPFYGSKDGRFIAPEEIHRLGNVPPCSKAVVIHPDVQARMEREPGYALEIFAKIDAWFAYDAARNEAIIPGISAEMSQAVAIGADGEICNACSSRAGGRISISKSSDEMVQAYYRRMEKRAAFMRWLAKERLEEAVKG